MGRVGEGILAESVDVLVAAGREILDMDFLDRIAFGPQLLEDLLHMYGVPQQHAVGEQCQAPGCFGLGFLLLA
jgi:hypothetical protein